LFDDAPSAYVQHVHAVADVAQMTFSVAFAGQVLPNADAAA
jgi:hypothetical protein